MNSMKRPALSFASPLLLLGLSLLLAGCGADEIPASTEPREALLENVEILTPVTLPGAITALGEVVPDHRVEAASRLSAYIEAIPKKDRKSVV